MDYTLVTDIEIGDSVYFDGEAFVVTNVEQIEDPDWAGEKPIGANLKVQITLDVEGVFVFSPTESLWVEKR